MSVSAKKVLKKFHACVCTFKENLNTMLIFLRRKNMQLRSWGSFKSAKRIGSANPEAAKFHLLGRSAWLTN